MDAVLKTPEKQRTMNYSSLFLPVYGVVFTLAKLKLEPNQNGFNRS
jgi:hypothetical protein